MNDKDQSILRFLASGGSSWEPWYFPFKPICQQTGMDRKEVRRRVRRLARNGYAEFCSGLWSEDGMPAGSGYCITKAGREFLKAQT